MREVLGAFWCGGIPVPVVEVLVDDGCGHVQLAVW